MLWLIGTPLLLLVLLPVIGWRWELLLLVLGLLNAMLNRRRARSAGHARRRRDE